MVLDIVYLQLISLKYIPYPIPSSYFPTSFSKGKDF